GKPDRTVFQYRVVERLHSKPIPSKHEDAAFLIPQRKSKHASKVFDRARAVLFVKMDDRLGVAARAVEVPRRFKRGTKLAMVVDLAVKSQPDASVFVGDRLMTAAEICDRQPAMTRPNASF